MKLNNKGYMLVEVIVASTILIIMAYFLMDITIKLVNKNNDYYLESILVTDKSLITKEIMDDINSMNLTGVNCLSELDSCELTFNNDENTKKTLNVENRTITYGDYSKTFNSDLKLSPIVIDNNIESEILTLKISAYTNYSKEDYGIKIVIPYNPDVVSVTLPSENTLDNEKNNSDLTLVG